MYILSYSNTLTRISCGKLRLETDDPPMFSLTFGTLYLEKPANPASKALN